MRKCLNHPAVDDAKTAGAVGHRQPAEDTDKPAENADTDEPRDRLLVLSIPEEAGTDNHVGIGLDQVVNQPLDFTGAMLAIAVHLDSDVVTVEGGVAIAGLHGPADAQIEWQAHQRGVRGNLAQGVVRGAIVDDQHIKMRQRPLQAMSQLANRLAFVERRDYYQTPQLRIGRQTLWHVGNQA